MAGAGKSTIGSALARATGFNFTDLDQYIQQKMNQTIQNIIDTRGEETLLLLEEQGMYEIDLQRRIVAPGGSLIYQFNLMKYLQQQSIIVYLDETYENIERRVKNATTRGIIGLRDKSLREIYDERKPLYVKYAEITVHPEGKSKEDIVQEILNQYLNIS
jgi:shikimate kinase